MSIYWLLVAILGLPWLLAAVALVMRWFAWRREVRAWERYHEAQQAKEDG